MKQFFSLLTLLCLAFNGAACSDSDDDNGSGNQGNGPDETGFSIAIEVSNVKATSAMISVVPSDPAEEYRLYVITQSDYKPSNIPSQAKTLKGNYSEQLSGLELGTDYYVVAAAEMAGYTKTEGFTTLGSGGTTDPSGHPDDFIVKNIPMKQARSDKRGISGSFQMPNDAALLGKGVAWSYDWSHNYPSYSAQLDANDMVFLPMVWNAGINRDAILKYAKDHPDAKYLLGYNEPNLTDQANMTPAQAAAVWPSLKAVAQEAGLKLISPALNYGTLPGYSDPEKWMDEFLACDGVSLDDFDAIALHCYMPNTPGMRAMIHKFDKYGKPIFMTEFCHANNIITNDVPTQISFMSDILNMLESDAAVGGYSWFMVRAGGDWGAISLLTSDASNQALTDLGRLYVNFSSFDKSVYYKPGEVIPAEHYVAHNMSGVSASQGWKDVFAVRPTTDRYGELMLSAYQTGAWVEYQIEVSESRTYSLATRYLSSIMEGTFDLSVDGQKVASVTYPKDEVWKTLWTDLNLTVGKHTLRLTHKSGRTDINWFYLD